MTKLFTKKTKGFTLMELLVVTVVIAGLALLLWPSFSSAREKSRRASCHGYLGQIGLAVAQYSDDYSRRLPTLGIAYSATTGVFSNLSLASHYFGTAQILVCPSDSAKSALSTWTVGNDLNNCSYAYQGAGSGFVATNMVWQADPNDIISWDRGVTGCTAGAGYGSATFGVDAAWLTNSPHKGIGGNVLYNDGHVSWSIRISTNASLGCMNPS